MKQVNLYKSIYPKFYNWLVKGENNEIIWWLDEGFWKKRFWWSYEILSSWLFFCKAPNQYSYEFVRVVTLDEKYAREQQVEMISSKCCYENDDIIVVHNVISFPDGSKEAVLACHMKKDGKIISSEAGATPLS